MKYLSYSSLIVLALIINSCYYDNEAELFQYVQQEECIISTATYAADVVPVLNTHCIRCHRDGRQDGNVNLEGYNNAKNYADNGSLYGTASHSSGYPIMPTSGVKIPNCDLEILRIWIEDGAPNN